MEATEKARQFARAFSVGTCSVGENGSMQEAIKTAANHPPRQASAITASRLRPVRLA
jgi:hypothetical protein